MQKVLILKGLPASGKSTWSKNFCEKNTDWVRVNRDSLRRMRGKYWLPKQENLISEMERACMYAALAQGKNVIVDDTNLNPSQESQVRNWVDNYQNKIAVLDGKEKQIQIEVKKFNVPVLECVKRDLQRPESVGKEVIMMMYDKYLKPKIEPIKQDPNLPRIILCDLDGTVCIHNGRSAFDYDKCETDLPNLPVIKIIKNYLLLNPKNDIIFFSGREDKCCQKSLDWLKRYIFEPELNMYGNRSISLYMRKTGDYRKDCIIKKELFDTHIRGKYYVDFILDDRNQVVEMWREMGLTCLQVAPGDF